MLSIIIPAYNEEQSIGRCLDALASQDVNEPFEVIVVDNASTDRTAEVARKYEEKLNLRVIRELKKGRGAARRTGFAAAKGEIILSTDADATPPSHWIATLVTELRKHPEAAAVTSPLEIHDCSPLKNAVLNCQWMLMWVYRLIWGHFWMNGFSFAVRRAAYEAAGGFNPHADAQEDSELSTRVCRFGIIRLVRSVPVLASGRRFQRSLLHGLWPYLSSFLVVRLSKGRKRADLSDVR